MDAQYRHEAVPKQIDYPAMSATKVSPFLDRLQSLATANFVSAIEAQSSMTFLVFTTLLTVSPFSSKFSECASVACFGVPGVATGTF